LTRYTRSKAGLIDRDRWINNWSLWICQCLWWLLTTTPDDT